MGRSIWEPTWGMGDDEGRISDRGAIQKHPIAQLKCPIRVVLVSQ